MRTSISESNKLFVLEAFDTLFNQRDYEAAARFWSADYIQHSAHIEPGREGLFRLTRSLPSTLQYENAHALAEGDLVILHGRFSGHGLPRNWVVADIVRLENGKLMEHWDVIQDEATEAESKSCLPMFGSRFAPAEKDLGVEGEIRHDG
jgi:predicted SnoaL-like aldol condensation-catalyzing enzyme